MFKAACSAGPRKGARPKLKQYSLPDLTGTISFVSRPSLSPGLPTPMEQATVLKQAVRSGTGSRHRLLCAHSTTTNVALTYGHGFPAIRSGEPAFPDGRRVCVR